MGPGHSSLGFCHPMVSPTSGILFFCTLSQKCHSIYVIANTYISDSYTYVQSYPFTGKEKDSETGFYNFGARYYDSDLSGLFLSVDPMADKYPNISPYSYCAWNPVRLVDPKGREIWIIGSDGNSYQYKNGQLYDAFGDLYSGEDDFATRVCSDISTLKQNGLQKQISRMEKSNKTITICETKGGNSQESTNKKLESRLFIGSGSIIKYNPNQKRNNDGEREPVFGLAHELGHAYDAMRGRIDDTPCKVYRPIGNDCYEEGFVPYSEIRAVEFENIARPNNKQRTTYDGFELHFYLQPHEGSIESYYGLHKKQ